MNDFFRAHNSARSGAAPLSKMFESVAILCQATQGSIPLVEALRRMALTFGTDVISVCRVDMRTDRGTSKVFSHETRKRISEELGPLEVSFAAAICGLDFSHAKVGSVWFGREENLEDQPRLIGAYRDRRLVETAAIMLDKKNGTSDFLELHFGCPISSDLETSLEILAPILSDCWKARAMGRFSDALLSRGRVVPDRPKVTGILSMENPCRLSRAEYRVCLLLGRGLNNQALLSELSITMATLRTHLRNIYAKTGTASQTELIHLLLRPDAGWSQMGKGSFDVA